MSNILWGREVPPSFLFNNFIAQRKSDVQHQKVRMKAKAVVNLSCVARLLCLRHGLPLALSPLVALALGLLTQNMFISVLPPPSCQIETHTAVACE